MRHFCEPICQIWIFGWGKKSGSERPSLKRYKSELKTPTQPLSSWVTPNFEKDTIADIDGNEIIAGTNIEAAKTIKEFLVERPSTMPSRFR